LLLVDLLVVGLITVATRERLIVDAQVRWSQSAFEEESVARWARRHWSSVRRAADARLQLDTLADGFFLVRATSHRGAEGGLLIRTITLRPLLAAFPAAISTDGPILVGTHSVIDVASARTLECVADSIPLATGPGIATPGWPFLLSGSRVDAQPAILNGRLPQLNPATIDTLQRLVDHTASGAIRFELAPDGPRCRHTPKKWSTADKTVSVCYSDYPLVLVNDLTLSGATQGVFLVEGTLTLEADARFSGAILLLGGRLVAARGALVNGAIRGLAANAILLSGAHVRYDACAVWRALAGSDALNQPLLTPRTWVPVFSSR
jgi:hypothetical protein